MKRYLFPLWLLCFLFLYGCAGTGHIAPHMRRLVGEGKFEEAKKFAYSDNFYDSGANEPLMLMERGMTHYLNGEYYQALKSFEKTAELFEQAYTISISKTLLSPFTGSSYEADGYEYAMLFFYQSLSHYHLSQQGYYESFQGEKETIPQKDLNDSERKRHLEAARALLIQWNDFQEKTENEHKGENFYARDMLAKSWGGYIHTRLGTNADLQSARILYKGMEPLLRTSYKIYPSFNDREKKELKNYAKEKTSLLSLSSKERQKKAENVELLVKTGLISQKEAESFSFPLNINNDYLQLYKEFNDRDGLIYFEIPTIRKPEGAPSLSLKIYEYTQNGKKDLSEKKQTASSEKAEKKETNVQKDSSLPKKTESAKGKLIAEKPLVLMEPVSEIAYQEYQNIRPKLIAKAVAEITFKYSLAIAAAVATYESVPDDSKQLAYLQLALTIQMLNYTQSADTRYWSTIPAYIFQQSVKLEKGKYILEIHNKEGKILYKDSFEINGKRPMLLDITLPKVNPSEKGDKK